MPPPHPPILALGYSEAAQYLRQHPANILALISIHSPHEPALDLPLPLRLDLIFDDTDIPDPADPIASIQAHIHRRTSADHGRPLTPPTLDHVQQIIDFAHQTRSLPGTLLCHCTGGISRSPAAALITLATWTGPNHEPYCLHLLKSLRPAAQPHPDLIRLADHLLHRHGALIAALRPSPHP